MAKKFVRGITDIKNIEHQDFDTNNVNDLLSDGKHNYIHRKKGNSEEYHNLTNNIKTIESSNTSLLSVTNYNNTTNSARLTPKHDRRKEQVLESTDETILISHGENGTDETTSVDVNPAKVLQHDNLVSNSDYVTIEHEHDSDTSVIKTDKLESELEIVGQRNYVLGSGTAKSATDGILYNLSSNLDNVPVGEPFIIEFDWSVTAPTPTSKFRINRVIEFSDGTPNQWNNTILDDGHTSDLSTSSGSGHYCGIFYMIEYNSTAVKLRHLNLSQTVSSGTVTISNLSIRRGYLKSDWTPAPEDSQIVSNTSIGVSGTGLMQLYSYQMSYSSTSQGSFDGTLDTYAKTVKKATSLTTDPTKLEYHFTAKLYEGKTSITIPLNENDTTYFEYILTNYNRTAMINGFVFSLSGSNLTISRDSSTYSQIVSFSDIINPSQETE